MKLFLIWAEKGAEFEKFMSTLTEAGHQIVYWVGLEGERSEMPGTVFHDHYQAWEGKPANGLEEYIKPPGAELISRMYETESMVLTMMDKRFDSLTTNARKHLYYRMLGYWHNVLKSYKPDMVVFPAVPHTVYNYIIYDLAKLLGIKTIMFEDSWIPERMLAYKDWRIGNENFAKKISEYRNRKIGLADLPSDLQDYYRLQTTTTADATPLYMQEQKKRFSKNNQFRLLIKKIPGAIQDGSIFKRAVRYFFRRNKPNLAKEYSALETPVDLQKPYVYVPLSFQPERTTCPQGGVFVDQILLIETLAVALPHDWVIYVKEHPSQWWLRGGTLYSAVRFEGYYRRIAAIRGVKLVPIHTNTFDLINNAKAVAVATGTAGWEALIRGIPAIIFGYPWYRNCLEILRVNDIESSKQVFDKIRAGFRPRPAEIIKFLKILDEICIHGHLEGYFDKVWKFSRQESINNASKEIIKELRI